MLAARQLLRDEAAHDARAPDQPLPPLQPQLLSALPLLSASSDLLNLKKKFPFLNQYSDDFIRSAGPLMLIKAEAASRKLQEYDRGRRAEDKLMANRESLASTSYPVMAGSDNRLDAIHPSRFLPGAACPATKLWLKARETIGSGGHVPLSTYDLGSIGLSGCVSPRGWVEIHNPASTSISIKMFALGNTEKKGRHNDADFCEMEDLSELKNAVRTLRAAMTSVHPWNRSVDALESFLIQSAFCSADLASVSKQVPVLTKFIDFVLQENANRWRDMEPFLTTRELRATWSDFYSQKAASLQKLPSAHQPAKSLPASRPPPSVQFLSSPTTLFPLPMPRPSPARTSSPLRTPAQGTRCRPTCFWMMYASSGTLVAA